MLRNNKEITGIRIDDKIYKLSQYADDTKIFLDGTEKSLRETLKTVNAFYKLSGVKFNVEKTRVIWIGSKNYSNERLCTDFDLDWNQGIFKVL